MSHDRGCFCGREKYEYQSCDRDDCYNKPEPDYKKMMQEAAAEHKKTHEHIESIKAKKLENSTLRDQFALAALSGLIANGQNKWRSEDDIADHSYRIADTMMRVRNKEIKENDLQNDLQEPNKQLSENAVVLMNERQRDTRFHPYTCPGNHPECKNIRELIATKERWVCQCGRYTQEYQGAW